MGVDRAIVALASAASVPLLVMIAYAAPPRLGLAWDVPMALGAAALGALAVLPVLTARQWLAATASVRLARFAHCHHRHLSYAVALLVAVHAGWPLAAEPRLIEYLLPGAPWPMLAGVGATLIVALLTLTSLGRRRRRRDYAGWRRRHGLWSAAALALALWHVLGSGYYYPRAGQALALALVVAVPLAAVYRPPPARRRTAAIPAADERHAIGGERRHSGSVLLALLVLWSALAVLHALPGAGVEDGEQHCPCPEAQRG